MEFQKLINRALDLQRQYARREQELYGSPSSAATIAESLQGDVRNIGRLLAAGSRESPSEPDARLAALLSHCLWSLAVLANMQAIELEQSFLESMDRLEAHLLESD